MQSLTNKPIAFNMRILRIACIALLSAPVSFLAASLPLVVYAPAAVGQPKSAEALTEIIQAITVRLEGATQGTGVLVKREANNYTVLTAWHVVSGQRPGEELDIYTFDREKHPAESRDIIRVGTVDMAVLTFSSNNHYQLAQIGDLNDVYRSAQLVVAGFPGTSNGRLTVERGRLLANAAAGIDQGYQLLYTNKTWPGMSGGAVLNNKGELVGIHGRGEIDQKRSKIQGEYIKTGINQGVPINYFKMHESGKQVVASSTQPIAADDYIAKAMILVLSDEYTPEGVISLANLALEKEKNAAAYFLRGLIKARSGNHKEAILDYNLAIQLDPYYTDAYNNRGFNKSILGDRKGAISDYDKAIEVDPQNDNAYNNRGTSKYALGDAKGAILDYKESIKINPNDPKPYNNMAVAKSAIGDKLGALADYDKAISIEPQYARAYRNRGRVKRKLGDNEGAIKDASKAISIDPGYVQAFNDRAAIWQALGNISNMCSDLKAASDLGDSKARQLFSEWQC